VMSVEGYCGITSLLLLNKFKSLLTTSIFRVV
jgi:hypothetical protein